MTAIFVLLGKSAAYATVGFGIWLVGEIFVKNGPLFRLLENLIVATTRTSNVAFAVVAFFNAGQACVLAFGHSAALIVVAFVWATIIFSFLTLSTKNLIDWTFFPKIRN